MYKGHYHLRRFEYMKRTALYMLIQQTWIQTTLDRLDFTMSLAFA